MVKLLLCFATVVCCAGGLFAQPPVTNPGLPERVPSALDKGVVKPDAFYLRDSGGNYIFVPNLRYEEFERLLRSQKPLLDPQLPSYQILSWEMAGEAQEEFANWDVTIVVRLSSAAAAAVAIPVGLSDWHLSANPEFAGEGEHLLELMSSAAGYQWWIKGTGNSEHTLKLRLVSKITQTAERSSVKTSLPAAPIRIRLRTNGGDLRPEIEGQSGIVIASEPIENNKLEFRYETSGGNQTLQWRRGGESARSYVIECKSSTRSEVVESEALWKCSTNFVIESSSGEFPKEFIISLPAGATWKPGVSDSSEANLFLLETTETGESNTAAMKEVLVRCRMTEGRRSGLVEIPIEWSWVPQTVAGGAQIRMIAPQIQGVDRHEGIIDIIYPAKYRLMTLANSNMFPVPSELTNAPDVNSVRYRFDRQLASLNFSLRPEFSETRLRPTYVVEVYRNRLLLRGIIDVSLPQGQSSSLLISPSNWSISKVEQASTGGAISIQPEGENRLRLLPPQVAASSSDSTRSAAWKMEGVRELADDRSLPLSIDLPSLINELPGGENSRFDFGSGTLVLVPADNVMLQPNENETIGLIADSEIPAAAMEVIPQERRRRAVAYRFQSAPTAPRWSGVRDLLPQQVTAEIDAIIDVSSQLVSVTQRWKVRVANEPLSTLRMIVDRKAFETSSIIATIDGNTVSILEATPDPSQSTLTGADEVLVGFMQTGDLVGELQIAVDMKYSVALLETAATENTAKLARLLLPDKTGYLKANLSVNHSPDVELLSVMMASQDGEDWKSLDWISAKKDVPLQIDSSANRFRFQIKKLDQLRTGTVRVLRAWLQSAFNTAQRRDRMVFSLETMDRRLSVQVTPESLADLYEVLIDGKRAIYSVDKEAFTLMIEMPEPESQSPRTVEIWSETGRSVTGEAVQISLPTILNSRGHPPFFWELILPSSEHLLFAPANMTPEWQWVWGAIGWHRYSPTNQVDFETWLGASTQSPLPVRLNRYVMSGFGIPSSLRFTILPKPWIWLPVGALIIAFTLAWSTLRSIRHPIALSILFVAIATLAIYFPDAAIVLGQLTVLASSLALIMLMSQWAIGRRVKRRSVFTSYPPSGSQPAPTGSVTDQRPDKSNQPTSSPVINPASGTVTVTNPGVVES